MPEAAAVDIDALGVDLGLESPISTAALNWHSCSAVARSALVTGLVFAVNALLLA